MTEDLATQGMGVPTLRACDQGLTRAILSKARKGTSRGKLANRKLIEEGSNSYTPPACGNAA